MIYIIKLIRNEANITSFRNKLISLFYKTATGSKKIRNFFTPIGIIFFFSLIGLLITVSLWTDKALHFPNLISDPLNTVISFFILSIGLFLILWSISNFIKVKGTPVPLNPPPKLVTTGPYSYIRNPMLSGVFILMFGFGILFNSISLVFISTPIFILLNFLELKTIEEPELEKRLGKDYSKYKKRVPMFFPRFKKN
ncbi:MAG: isoprenylcysteine carboxylmethyltransferase family protein [Atribacterota bacterium]|nr:isoprenylcysteine carboxylmethyltransferase family protein [Atribacterota bacterium]